MRLLVLPVLCGALAGLTCAQGFRGGAYGQRQVIRVPARSTTFGAPQLPPGTAINGVPGIQNSATLNGLPLFSNRTYQFGCLSCGANRRRRSGYPPSVGFVPLFDSYSFPTSLSEEDLGPPPPMVDPAAVALTSEINKLRGDINQLREQAQAPAPPVPAAAPAPNEPPQPATVIVMRDGRQIETTNYAVMDQTLWNFSAHPVQKIPVSSIDISASEKANSERGIDFGLSADSTK